MTSKKKPQKPKKLTLSLLPSKMLGLALTLELEGNGEPGDSRLFGVLRLAGCLFHAEAVPVKYEARDNAYFGEQVGIGPFASARLNALGDELSQRAFQTVFINEREYALFIYPGER